MTYSELQDVVFEKKITIQEVANHIGMTYNGMKTSFENQTLPIRSVSALCEYLGITPNRFFNWKETKTNDIHNNNSNIQNGGVGNIQNADATTIAALQDQLRVKDEQIAKLLNLLADK
jgi:DNA-binding Xre family transcriptional regulator